MGDCDCGGCDLGGCDLGGCDCGSCECASCDCDCSDCNCNCGCCEFCSFTDTNGFSFCYMESGGAVSSNKEKVVRKCDEQENFDGIVINQPMPSAPPRQYASDAQIMELTENDAVLDTGVQAALPPSYDEAVKSMAVKV
ncbi:hypothetical protein FQR65_LT03027 [Abscondita terminalis]|nr:hypothetical protein FQR65_LT03027 [Abscondita terminalis]